MLLISTQATHSIGYTDLSLRALPLPVVRLPLLGGHPRKCLLQHQWSALTSHRPGCEEAYAAKVGALMRSVLFSSRPAMAPVRMYHHKMWSAWAFCRGPGHQPELCQGEVLGLQHNAYTEVQGVP